MKIRYILVSFIFLSRWLQAPLYIGLIFVLGAYVYEFFALFIVLIHHLNDFNETQIMMGVLDLIDVVMIANLLIMVIIGGFEIFVTRLRIHNHPDNPEWLNVVNASTMKVKLAIALISISSIHLLKTFFDVGKVNNSAIIWQVTIHLTLLVSALAIALTHRMTEPSPVARKLQSET